MNKSEVKSPNISIRTNYSLKRKNKIHRPNSFDTKNYYTPNNINNYKYKEIKKSQIILKILGVKYLQNLIKRINME